MTVIGQKFMVDFVMAKAILHFQSERSLVFTITEKDGVACNVIETVLIQLTEIRPSLFIVTWQEASGTTVTQIQDFERETIYSSWTTPAGGFINSKGVLTKYHNVQ